MKRILGYTLVLLAACAFPFTALSQEHPEHPTRHEHPKKTEKAKDYSTADLEKAIKKEVATRARDTDGIFKLKDVDKTWDLSLQRVHTDRLSKLNADTYFACVDMKDPDGKTIDVDFFLESADGQLEMTDITVHKIEGKPRYNWKEEDGFWKRVAVAE